MKQISVVTDVPPINLLKFKEWIEEAIERVPEQYRDNALIEIDYMEWGDERGIEVCIDICYDRPLIHHEIIQKNMLDRNRP
jgi:7,8-dihydro-6-hydroxymethylpterin-pyrophosphokinase